MFIKHDSDCELHILYSRSNRHYRAGRWLLGLVLDLLPHTPNTPESRNNRVAFRHRKGNIVAAYQCPHAKRCCLSKSVQKCSRQFPERHRWPEKKDTKCGHGVSINKRIENHSVHLRLSSTVPKTKRAEPIKLSPIVKSRKIAFGFAQIPDPATVAATAWDYPPPVVLWREPAITVNVATGIQSAK
jgi:hypothetical protein